MHSSSADWVLGEARLISSAITTLANTGPGTELELLGLPVVDRHPGDVAGQQVRGELHPAHRAVDRDRQRLGQRGLAHPRHVLDQEVALGQQRDEREAHDVRLAHEHLLRRWRRSGGPARPPRAATSRRPTAAGTPRRFPRPPAPWASASCPSSSPDPPRRPATGAPPSVANVGSGHGRTGWSARPDRFERSAGPLPTVGPATPHRPPPRHRIVTKSHSPCKLLITDCLDREVVTCPAIGWGVGFPHLAPLCATCGNGHRHAGVT